MSSDEESALNLSAASDALDVYEPTYKGTHVHELDLDSLESKPWRNCQTKEEITQYFNYGFDEITYRMF